MERQERDRLIDVPATRERLGNLSRSGLDELRRRGELVGVTIGRRRLYPESEIDAYLDRLRNNR